MTRPMAGYPQLMADHDAVLHGGPHNGTTVSAAGAGLLELERDGLIHRYIATDLTRGPQDDLAVYAYDGVTQTDGSRGGPPPRR